MADRPGIPALKAQTRKVYRLLATPHQQAIAAKVDADEPLSAEERDMASAVEQLVEPAAGPEEEPPAARRQHAGEGAVGNVLA